MSNTEKQLRILAETFYRGYTFKYSKGFRQGMTRWPMLEFQDSYQHNITFRVGVEGALSSIHHISTVILQGSILRSLLFTCYTADIAIQADRIVQIAVYVDDSTISLTSSIFFTNRRFDHRSHTRFQYGAQ